MGERVGHAEGLGQFGLVRGMARSGHSGFQGGEEEALYTRFNAELLDPPTQQSVVSVLVSVMGPALAARAFGSSRPWPSGVRIMAISTR